MPLGKKMKIAKGDLKYIPLYETWLYKHARDLESQHRLFGKIIDRPERVRTNTFSASGAGQCLRRRQLSYLGYPQEKPNERTMNIFVNGDFVHLRHQIAGLRMGYLTDAEVSVSKPEYRLTGTMDGDGADGELAEFKSINSNGFRGVTTYGVKHEHNEQVHSYMLCSDKDEARVLYENKDTQDLKEFLVKRNPATIDKVVGDLEMLNSLTDNETLAPPLAECMERKGHFTSCPFRKVCLTARYESQERGPKVVASSIRVRRNSPSD